MSKFIVLTRHFYGLPAKTGGLEVSVIEAPNSEEAYEMAEETTDNDTQIWIFTPAEMKHGVKAIEWGIKNSK